MTPDNHCQGQGCPLCKNNVISNSRSQGLELFIAKARKRYKDLFDYSEVVWGGGNDVMCH